MRAIPATAALLAGLFIASCGPGWATPTITPHHVSVRDVSLSGLTVDVLLDVYNPNAETLPVREVHFDLRVGDSSPCPGHGVVSNGLAPMQTTQVPVEVHVSGGAAFSVATQMLAGRRNYTIQGDVTIEYRGMRRVGFEQAGHL